MGHRMRGNDGGGTMLIQDHDVKSSRNYSNFARINCGCLGGGGAYDIGSRLKK